MEMHMDKVSGRIRELVARQVKKRGIVVWYDPEGYYTELARNLGLAGRRSQGRFLPRPNLGTTGCKVRVGRAF
jgi:hypothetical protein